MRKARQLSREQLARVLYAPNLSYFVAVAELGSIREASRVLNISASAVSRQIVQLEDTIGTPLFDRIGGKLRISPAGETLLRHCESTLRDLEATIADIDSLQGLRTGSVRVASAESFSAGFLPQLVVSFAAQYPLIRVDTVILPSDEVADRVAESKVDMGFAFNPVRVERFSVHLRRRFPLGVVVAKDHPLAGLRRIAFAQCLQYPTVLPAAGLSLRASLDTVMGPYANALRSFIETNSLRFMTELVLAGPYVSFQTRIGIEPYLARGALVFLELAEPAVRTEDFALITHAQGEPRLAPAAFLDHVRATLPALLDR